MIDPGDPPPCAGRWAEFDSIDPDVAVRCRAICGWCPARVRCAGRAAEHRREHLVGTWAGVTYGLRGRPRDRDAAEGREKVSA